MRPAFLEKRTSEPTNQAVLAQRRSVSLAPPRPLAIKSRILFTNRSLLFSFTEMKHIYLVMPLCGA
jgi:hypothetical protein